MLEGEGGSGFRRVKPRHSLLFLCIGISGLLQELEEKERTNGNIPNGSTHKPDKGNKKEKDKVSEEEDEKTKEPDYTPEQLAEVKR